MKKDKKRSLFKIDELSEALRSAFSKPFTVKYPYAPSPAPEGFRGKPEFDEEKCMGCGACSEVCPGEAISIMDEGDTRKIELFYGMCTFCGLCEECCPIEEKGIRLTTEFKMVFSDKDEARTSIEKPLVRCEHCGEPITTVDHLKWMIDRLGPLAFSNATLVSVIHDLTLGKTPIKKPERKEIDRADVIRILCPKCRRRVAVIDHGYRVRY